MANELDPRTRKEVFLAGMLYGDPDDLPDPNTRDELYMKAIAETIKEGGVPSPEGADVGDVLTIGADGPEWAAPAGGGLYLHRAALNIGGGHYTNAYIEFVDTNSETTLEEYLAKVDSFQTTGYFYSTAKSAVCYITEVKKAEGYACYITYWYQNSTDKVVNSAGQYVASNVVTMTHIAL